MTFAILQVVLALVAGYLVFRLWRNVAAANRVVFWLVTVGTLVRAVGGQLAFWISYLELPIARSLQIGRGLWWFGIDATSYFDLAVRAAAHGPMAIIHLDKTVPSPFYIQMLAVAVLAFGALTSVAILLNVAAYLAGCRVILSFGGSGNDRAVAFAIAVLSLAPSTVVWSLQPMKDMSFFFLVIAFFGSARMWQQLWGETKPRWVAGAAALWTLALAGLLYGISGIRWYFGFLVLAACAPFLLLTVVRTRRHLAAAVASLVLFIFLAAGFFTGAKAYIPPPVRTALFGGNLHDVMALPSSLLNYLHSSRLGFDRSGGTTLIGAGGALRKLDEKLGVKETRVPTAVGSKPAAATPPVAAATSAHPPARPVGSPASSQAPLPPPATSGLPAHPPQPAVQSPAPVPATSAPQSAAVVEGSGVSNETVAMPGSAVGRMVAGTAAVVLPQWVARQIGLIDVRGGRGLWFFVEVDTIVFDIVLAFAIVSVVRAARRRKLRSPVFWLLFLVTLTVGGLLAYTVSNFGTLFRHRDMFLIGLSLLPVAAASSGLSEEGDPESVKTRTRVGEPATV